MGWPGKVQPAQRYNRKPIVRVRMFTVLAGILYRALPELNAYAMTLLVKEQGLRRKRIPRYGKGCAGPFSETGA